jgi:hypothetical protein
VGARKNSHERTPEGVSAREDFHERTPEGVGRREDFHELTPWGVSPKELRLPAAEFEAFAQREAHNDTHAAPGLQLHQQLLTALA